MRTLTGLDPSGPYMGVKQFGLSRERKLNYMISLFDQQDGAIVALLDANSITALRTAATTAVALDYMAPRDADTLGVVGSGAEAFTHVRAAHVVRPLQRLSVFSPTPEKRAAFAKAFEAETGVPSQAVDSVEQAVRGHAIVIGATRAMSGKPIIEGRWLAPETVLASIGATIPPAARNRSAIDRPGGNHRVRRARGSHARDRLLHRRACSRRRFRRQDRHAQRPCLGTAQ